MTTRLPPIETKRLYQHISAILRQSMDDGRFAVGSFLPPERELAEQLGVSRTSVREALIALEVAGRVSVRVGAGVQVLPVPEGAAERVPLAEPPIGPLDVLDARLVVEPETAAGAARQATAADLEGLTARCRQMSEEYRRGSGKHEADRAFHLDIARIAGNAALELLVTKLWDLRRTPLQERFESIFKTPERNDATERDHALILQAITMHDEAAAREAMQRHLARVRQTLVRAIEVG